MSARWERLWYGGPESLGQRLGRAPLSLAAAGFGAAVAVRELAYARGWAEPLKVPGARVLSVGNLTVGGAGKTPAVLFLARRLVAAGHRVGVVTRGYGRTSRDDVVLAPGARLPSAEDAGDEPLFIAQRCPQVHVLVSARRAAFAVAQAPRLGLDVLVLDDGFQHRRLARDLDVVAVDERAGFGNGRLLPRGPLREPLRALARAGLFWVRVDEAGTAAPLALPGPTVRVRYVPEAWLGPRGERAAPDAFLGRPVVALSGIARPGAFEATLHGLGVELVRHVALADHARVSSAVLAEVTALAAARGASVVTTEKDACRLPADVPAWRLSMAVQVVAGQHALDAALARALGEGRL